MVRIKKVARGNALVEFSDTDEQGETKKLPLPELLAETEEPTDLSKEATRILATLWQRQKHHFKDDFSQRLKKRGVLIVPGDHFFPGLKEDLPHKQQCIRINYSPDERTVTKAIKIIADEIQIAYCRT